MSDEMKPASGLVGDPARRAPGIDLPKSAVTDITPEAEAPAPAPEPARVSAPAAAPVSPPPRASGTVPVLGGAVAGAIFGLMGAVGYQNVQAPPVTVADGRVAQVETAIAAVEKKTVDAAAIEKRLADQLKAAETRAAALEQKAAALEAKATALDGKAAALEQKTTEADGRTAAQIKAAQERAAGAEQKAAGLLAPVDDRLKTAEAKLAEAKDAALALNKRVDLLAQIEPPRVDLRPIITKVDELDRAIATSAARVTLNNDAALSLDGRVRALETALKTAETAARTAETSAKAAEKALADLKAAPAPVADNSAAILAVAGLARTAAAAGAAPLAPHLKALGGLGVAEAQLRPLTPFAERPVPRPAALADQFASLAAALPKPPAPAASPKTDSILDKVAGSLLSQVEVKRIDAPPPAIGLVADVRAKLLAGDVAGALAPVAALPADQQALLKPFTDAVAARAAALEALRKIEGDALAATGRKG